MSNAISNVNLQVLSLLKALCKASEAAKLITEEAAIEKSNSTSSNKSLKEESIESNINVYG